MGPGDTIRSYYDALEGEEPLAPYFADRETTVKFGIWESLDGSAAVADGLQEQTETTTDWAIESQNLTVDRAGDVAWFADEVRMGWTDTTQRIRYEFETRWSGTLVDDEDWQFVGMHVSTAGER